MAIGGLNESLLHASLKRLVAPDGAHFEVAVDGYVIDAVSDDLLIEIQTGRVGRLRPKLQRLLTGYRVRLVIPVAAERWIVRRGADGACPRRRSPKRAGLLDALAELTGIATLLDHPNLEVEAALVHDEEVREHRPGSAWRRRGWVTVERRLLRLASRHRLAGARAWLDALPPGLPEPFTTLDVAGHAARRPIAQRAVYVLREAGVVVPCGRDGRAPIYAVRPVSVRSPAPARSLALAASPAPAGSSVAQPSSAPAVSRSTEA